MKSTRSSFSRSRARSASARWPMWGGSKVPPNIPIRSTRPTRFAIVPALMLETLALFGRQRGDGLAVIARLDVAQRRHRGNALLLPCVRHRQAQLGARSSRSIPVLLDHLTKVE